MTVKSRGPENRSCIVIFYRDTTNPRSPPRYSSLTYSNTTSAWHTTSNPSSSRPAARRRLTPGNFANATACVPGTPWSKLQSTRMRQRS